MKKISGNAKRKKRAVFFMALVLAAVLPLTCAWAKGYVDTGRRCSVSVSISEDNSFGELKNVEITVKFFRIAGIDANGQYRALEAYSDIQEKLDAVDKNTKAAGWNQILELAKKDAANQKENTSVKVKNGRADTSDMETGLYLVTADSVSTGSYSYHFTSGLVSLPDNEFYSMGQGKDEWIYDNVAVSLKPERTERSGELEIRKTLKNYNPKTGTPLFVFDVEVYRGSEVVYSNVVSMSFGEKGTQSVKITGLPVGAKAVVKEIYSGASYTVESSGTVTIDSIRAGETAVASFTNDYNNKLIYGTGVVNHFTYDGNGYSWTQQKDNSAMANGMTE